jgi:hypothetical protein
MSKLIESVYDNQNLIIDSPTYNWNKVPIKLNYDIFVKIVDKLSVVKPSDKISYSNYPPNESDIYIMEYSPLQGIKRWWYSDNRWKTFELIELLMFNGVIYNSADYYDKTLYVCENLKKTYDSCEEFCKKYDELLKFVNFQNRFQERSGGTNRSINSSESDNDEKKKNSNNDSLQFFREENKNGTINDSTISSGNVTKNINSQFSSNDKNLSSNDHKHDTCSDQALHVVGSLSTPGISGSEADASSASKVDSHKHTSIVLSNLKPINIEAHTFRVTNDTEKELKKTFNHWKKSQKRRFRQKRRRVLLFW